MIRKLLLLVFMIGLSFTILAEERAYHMTVGGFIRLGGFDLTKSATEYLSPSVSYKGAKLEDVLGKYLFVNTTYNRFGLGARWMSYSLEGENTEIERTLDLEYLFVTASYAFLEGDFLHPKLDSRIGLTLGTGQNQYNLTTKSHKALANQTVNESVSSSAPALLSELFFTATTRSDWGYRLGYFIIHSVHSKKINNKPLDGSTEPKGYLAISWRY